MPQEASADEQATAELAEALAKENPFTFTTKVTLAIEKLRISIQIRKTQLENTDRECPVTNALLEILKQAEDCTDKMLAKMIESHPAFPWFSRVRGIGRENISKVVGLIDIEKARTVSGLWKYAGYHVENGHAPKRVKGGKALSYNNRLRMLCWRLANSLMRGQGKFYDYYLREKEKYLQRYGRAGIRIVPADELPKKGGKRYEPVGVMSEGHVHNQALRKMIKLFLSLLWVTWREGVNLPTRNPYPIDHLGHDHQINPWDMVDKEEKQTKKPRAKKTTKKATKSKLVVGG